MSVTIKLDTKEVEMNLAALSDRAIKRLMVEMGSNIVEAESYAKRTAPWTDRTGAARNSLMGTGPVVTSDGLATVLSGGMEYSPYLELKNFGKFRIIHPTIEMAFYNLMSRIADLLV